MTNTDLVRGQQAFNTHCVVCHGEKGLGDGVAAPTMTIKPDNIYQELINPFGFKAELILIVSMIGIALGIYQANVLAKPIDLLTAQVSLVELENPQISPLPNNDEIGFLSRAYADLINRLGKFIHLEKAFTRYASHELKTPLSILSSNLELLRSENVSAELRQQSIDRISKATSQMQRQIHTFLMLAREEQLEPSRHPVCWKNLLEDEAEALFRDRPDKAKLLFFVGLHLLPTCIVKAQHGWRLMMPKPLRIIFAGTPDFSVPLLSALIDAGHQIVAVYTQSDRPSGLGLYIKHDEASIVDASVVGAKQCYPDKGKQSGSTQVVPNGWENSKKMAAMA